MKRQFYVREISPPQEWYSWDWIWPLEDFIRAETELVMPDEPAPLRVLAPESRFGAEGVLLAIDQVCREAALDGWDGQGSIAVTPDVCENAKQLARLLPWYYPTPDVLAHPDGDLAFEWDRGRNAVFTVAVGKSEVVHYAALLGASRRHGAEPLGPELLTIVDAILERLYSPDLTDLQEVATRG